MSRWAAVRVRRPVRDASHRVLHDRLDEALLHAAEERHRLDQVFVQLEVDVLRELRRQLGEHLPLIEAVRAQPLVLEVREHSLREGGGQLLVAAEEHRLARLREGSVGSE